MLSCKQQEPAPRPAPTPAPNPPPAAWEVAPADAPDDASRCPEQPFAKSTPLPEASGAAWLTIEGKLALVVVADSGNQGDYVVLDPDTGATREQGKLPLG